MENIFDNFSGNLTLQRAGLRFGDKGTQSSRTIMFTELEELFRVIPTESERFDYTSAITEENILGKQTVSNRRLTNQRLGELYGLDRKLPIFRVFRLLWDLDPEGRPLLALLCALARDPLLRFTAPSILSLLPGAELIRTNFLEALSQSIGPRMNPRTLDQVARNSGSSWTQSGHLAGRVRKIRQKLNPTIGPAVFALWLGSIEGLAGEQLLQCRWSKVLDKTGLEMIELTLQAKQRGLIHALIGGGVVKIDVSRLDSFKGV